MAIVSISPEEQQRDYLEAGEYGPGLQHDAEVEILKWEFPAESRLPGWDKENKEGPYGWANIKVTTQDGKSVFIDHFLRTTQLKKFILATGASSAGTDDQGNFVFDSDEIAGRQLAGIVLGDPREYNGEMFTGNIKSVLGK